jgi:hypothetical protein
MMMSLFYFSFWAIMRGANFARPSALHRGYVQIWLFVLGWAMLVAVTVAEDRLRIGAGYMFVFLQSAVFLSVFIALCELFALPKKTAWGLQVREDHEARDFAQGHGHAQHSPSEFPPPIPHQESSVSPGTRESTSTPVPAPTNRPGHDDDDDTEAPTERTPLVGGNATTEHAPTTFATTYRRSISALVNGARRYSDSVSGTSPFEHEQAWSGRLPSWTWFLQFLLLGPFTIVLVGQTGLMLVDAVHQTGVDGSNLLLPYLVVFLATTLLFLPLSPFIHRVSHHLPLFLLAVFTGTLIYNLAAFPFSAASRYKAYFVQTLDLDSGANQICYSGVEEYLRPIIAALPSAAGQYVHCGGKSKRAGLVSCCFDGSGLPPNLLDDTPTAAVGDHTRHLVTVNATLTGENRASIEIVANNTKACFLEFARPVSGLKVKGGSGWDERFGGFPEAGVRNLRLWQRGWGGRWRVDVQWKGEGDASQPLPEAGTGVGVDAAESDLRLVGADGELRVREYSGDGEGGRFEGAVVCMWSDANVPGTIPALDEALRFAPTWAAITKLSEGLVEGRKAFSV